MCFFAVSAIYILVNFNNLLWRWRTELKLSNNKSDGSENVTKKLTRAASNFIALIPSRSVLQMLAIFSEVEF